ncbi:tetratricopeptide repeat protein [Oryzihumus sp.]|uniref:tetratricopeptide repeat protein n=1 Tax=Oryzihumus sp. TaxID=1968903 RepID=UPI002ED99A90
MTSAAAVSATEVRVLEGPNLYSAQPAMKVILQVPGYLAAPEPALRALAARVGLKGARPGAPDSEQRQRFVMRFTTAVVRRVAAESGTARLSVRTRTGGSRQEIVVAFPWRRRGRGLALGEALAPVLTALLDPVEAVGDEAVAGVIAAVTAADPGDKPNVVTPKVPVASITGTNGKTTTTRLLAHIGMTAGLRTAWSSTDGVVAQGEMVEPGDYSGPAGARTVLSTPGVQLGILETARGGMLLKGMGVSANDVSVVTNVSADHLGLQGIDTIDQLAEVKAIVTLATRPDGWVVLNGDDPRVWAMRTRIKARPWAFSLDPDSPALRESLAAGGRGVTVLDGDIVVLHPGADPDHLAAILDVPVTLSGLSEHNIANALAATAAALGLGLPRQAVIEGLRTFAPDPAHNPGRMNVYTYPLADGGTVTVIVDLAHNEAGLEALLRVCDGLRVPGALVHLGLGTAGDRTDDLLQSLGELAGRRADTIAAVHKEHYLRGRTMEDLETQLRIGLSRVGVAEIDSHSTELDGLKALVARASDGDVVAVMCHSDRVLLDAWLTEEGATPDDAAAIRRKVVAARGEHEQEAAITALWEREDAEARIADAQALLSAHPGDARLLFELGGAFDAAGQEAEAVGYYEQALAAGLREPHRHRAEIQLASSRRALGDPAAALEILDRLVDQRPGSTAVIAFRALAAFDAGRAGAAVADLVDALLAHSGDADGEAYRAALHRYAAALR